MSDAESERTCRKCKLTFTPSFRFDFYEDGTDDPKVGICERCMMNEAFADQKPTNDPSPIPAGYEMTVCKIGKGRETCGFLGMSGVKFQCLKGSSFESKIRERQRQNSLGAKGDNCSGPPEFKQTTASQ